MRSWKNYFFFCFRRKGIKKGTFPWGPSSVILKHEPHKYIKKIKASQRVFSQVFAVTQVKNPYYVLERGQQNQRHKHQPKINRGSTRMVLCLAALEAQDLRSHLIIPKHIQQLGNSPRHFLVSHIPVIKQKNDPIYVEQQSRRVMQMHDFNLHPNTK